MLPGSSVRLSRVITAPGQAVAGEDGKIAKLNCRFCKGKEAGGSVEYFSTMCLKKKEQKCRKIQQHEEKCPSFSIDKKVALDACNKIRTNKRVKDLVSLHQHKPQQNFRSTQTGLPQNKQVKQKSSTQ